VTSINYTKVSGRNVSFQLLRTNPKLTSNVKLTVDSSGDLWLNSINATSQLADQKYKRFPINESSSHEVNLYKFYDAGKTPSSIAYALGSTVSKTATAKDLKDQFDFDLYSSGAKYLTSKQYPEKFSYFAPIYLDQVRPQKFVIFKIKGASNYSAGEGKVKSMNLTNSDFSTDFLKKAELVKVFDLSPSSKIGKYLENISTNKMFSKNPLYVNYKRDGYSIYRGASLKTGTYVEIPEQLSTVFSRALPMLKVEQFVTLGFERNSIVHPRIVNLEFLFDDETSEPFSFNRYIGFYCNDIDLAELDIDLKAMYLSKAEPSSYPNLISGISTANITGGTVKSLAVSQDSTSIYIVGDFTEYNEVAVNGIAKLNANGTLDRSFSTGSGFNGTPRVIKIDSDGGILVGGSFTEYNGNQVQNFVKLLHDGSLYSGFLGFDNEVTDIAVTMNGVIYAAGKFTKYGDTSSQGLIRIFSTGEVDESFSIGSGFSGQDMKVSKIRIKGDSSILAIGNFTEINGTSVSNIIQLTETGEIDSDFDSGTGFNLGSILSDIIVDQLDNAFICGSFTSYNGESANSLIKLTRSGDIDETFVHLPETDGLVTQIAKDIDGRLYVGGQFSTYAGVPARGLARILSSGELDYSFDTSSGFNILSVNNIVIKDEDIYIAGGFTEYQGKRVSGLINLDNLSLDNDQYLPIEFKQSDDISFTLTNQNGVTLRGMNLDKDLSDIAKNRINSDNLFFAYLKTKNNNLHLIKSEDWYQSGNKVEFKIDNSTFDLGLTFGPTELVSQETAISSKLDSKSSVLIELSDKPEHLDILRVYHPSGSHSSQDDPNGKFDDLVFTRGYFEANEPYSLSYDENGSTVYINADLSIKQIHQAIIDVVDEFENTSISGVNLDSACAIQTNSFGDTYGTLKLKYIPIMVNNHSIKVNGSFTTDVVYADGGFLTTNHAIIEAGNITKLTPLLNSMVVKTSQNWSKISRLCRVTDLLKPGLSDDDKKLALDQFNKKATLVLEDREEVLVSYNKIEIRKLFRPKVGVLSMFEVMDFDFSTYSTQYSRNLPLDIYRDFYIPAGVKLLDFKKYTYKVIGDGTVRVNGVEYSATDLAVSGARNLIWQNIEELSKYEVISGTAILVIGNKFPNTTLDPLDESFPDRLDITYADESLDAIDYVGPFSLKANHAILQQNPVTYNNREKFINGNVQSEYHVYLENFTKEFATEGRVIPYINKWGAIDSTDSRDNPYRLNSDILFGKDNFGPSHRETSATPEKLTHEWFYIESDTGYSNDEVLAKYNFSYFNKPLDLTKLSSNDSYFDEYFTYVPTVNFKQVARPQYRYSIINKNQLTGQYEALFKGTLFRFYELNKTNSVKRFDDYKFTAILKPIKEDSSVNRRPVNYRVIENTNAKTITVVIELAVGYKSLLQPDMFSNKWEILNGNLISQSNVFSKAFTSSSDKYKIDVLLECSTYTEYLNYLNGTTLITANLGESILVKYNNYSAILATEGSAIYNAVRASKISTGDKLGNRRYAIVDKNTIVSLSSGSHQGVKIQAELHDVWLFTTQTVPFGQGKISSNTGNFNSATTEIYISPVSASSQQTQNLPFSDVGGIDHSVAFNANLVESTNNPSISLVYYDTDSGYSEEISYAITGSSGEVSENDTLVLGISNLTGNITSSLFSESTVILLKTQLDIPTDGFYSAGPGESSGDPGTLTVEHKSPYLDSMLGDYRIEFNQDNVSNLTHSFLYYAKDKKYNSRKTSYSTIKLSRGVDLSTSGIDQNTPFGTLIKTVILPDLDGYDSLADSEINQISNDFAPIYVIKPDKKQILIQTPITNPNPPTVVLGSASSTTDGIDGAIQDSLLVTNRASSVLRAASPIEISLGDSIIYKYSYQQVPFGTTSDWVSDSHHFQIMGGSKYFEKVFENLSFAKFAELLEKSPNVISWESYTDGQLSYGRSISIEILPADEIQKRTMVQIEPETVQTNQINQVAGYTLTEVPSTEYDINRYSTEYDILANPITAFNYEFSIAGINLPGANVKFNNKVDDFFVIPEFEFVKYAKTNILDLENSQKYSPVYPLISETTIDRAKYHTLSSSWDYGYHFEYTDKQNYIRVPGSKRISEDYSFVSKLLTLPNSILVEEFDSLELTNEAFLQIQALGSTLIYSKFNNELRFKLNISDLLTNQLITNGLLAEFKKHFKYADGSEIIQDSEFLGDLSIDQFTYEYCIKNLVQLYEIESFDFYELDDRTIEDNSIEFKNISSDQLTALGYSMVRAIQINNTKSAVIEGSILLKPNTGFKLVPKIKIKFI